MKKRKVKTLMQVWITYLDSLWRLIIHFRDKETCQWCGKTGDIKTDAHHIFSRDDKSTRFETLNGVLLCYHCHQYKLPKRPEDFRAFITLHIGIQLYRELHKQSKNILYDIPYETIEKVLLSEMENRNIPAPKKPRRLS
jgi:hypothetical protein